MWEKYHVEHIDELISDEELLCIARENAQAMSVILEKSDLLYWEYDFLTHTSYQGDKFVEALGGPKVAYMIPEEMDKYELIVKEDVPKIKLMYQKIIDGESSVEDEMRFITKTGVKRCRVTMNVIVDDNGQRVMAVGLVKNLEPLRELEECMRTMATMNQLDFIVFNLETNELEMFEGKSSDEILHIENYSELISLIKDKVHPADVDELKQVIVNARNGEALQEIEVRWRLRRHSAYRILRMSFTTQFNNWNHPIKVYGSIRDISDQQKRERQYGMKLAYMESFRVSSLFYAEVNIRRNLLSNITSRYPRLEQGVRGHTIEHWAKMLSSYSVREDKRLEIETTFQRSELLKLYERGINKVRIEAPLEVAEGYAIWAQIDMSLLVNPATDDAEGYIVISDITGSKQRISAGETVIAMDYEVALVVDSANGLIDKKYRFSGKGIREDYELPKHYDDFIEASVNGILQGERQKVLASLKMENVWKHVLKDGKYVMTLRAVAENNEYYHKRVTFTRLRSFRTKMLLTMQDITDLYNEERKKQRELRKALKEAKEAENAKIDFLARMSHDLRTPLNGILGMAEIAMDETNEEHIRQYMEKIVASGQLLLSLVNDILDVSQLEENRMKLKMEPYSVVGFLEMMNRIIGEQCKSKGLKYECKFDEIKDLWIVTDKLRFGQVFMNLLSNAVKYTPEGGDILFEAIVKQREDNKLCVEFVIEDTGIGMSKSFVEKAFDAFSQADSTSVDKRYGSGLGLNIVKQLVDLFGGKIKIQSELGVGTKITVEMSLETTQQEEVSEGTQEEWYKDLNGKHILVAEDQPLNAKILTKLLNKRGIIVDLAVDGQKAVNSFLESTEGYYAAVLMDIRMPHMDGLQATKVIRSHVERSDYDLPIIATTANAYVEDKMACLAAGMNDHITKPISSKELNRCLDNFIII